MFHYHIFLAWQSEYDFRARAWRQEDVNSIFELNHKQFLEKLKDDKIKEEIKDQLYMGFFNLKAEESTRTKRLQVKIDDPTAWCILEISRL